MSDQTHGQAPAGAPTSSYEFVIVDVFTETAFGGNQLAVIPHATGLSDEQMQKIAREFNFAESTFVIPSLRGKRDRIRIFTPKRELPFAGHPTVGTAAVLSFLRRSRPCDEHGLVTYEEGIGSVSTRVSALDGAQIFCELILDAPLEQPTERPDRRHLADTLSLTESDVLEAWFAAVGIPFCFIHLASQKAVDAAALDRQSWSATVAHTWAPPLFFFSGPFVPDGRLYARMFAPAFGIDEDPATGSACVALVGVLADRQRAREGSFSLHIDQGVAMGRPSAMLASAEKAEGAVKRLRLGGPSVIVARGTLAIESQSQADLRPEPFVT
jgi:trans-2,3-dihydro-3-hydroxyanthranilate isomerase